MNVGMETKQELYSRVMRSVRSRDNRTTELRLAQYLRDHRIGGWRRQYPLRANPDIAFPKLKVAVFTDGCFWHGHSCVKNPPKTNTDFWERKIRRNRERDHRANSMLRRKGWKVVRLWECELRRGEIKRLLEVLKEKETSRRDAPPSAPDR